MTQNSTPQPTSGPLFHLPWQFYAGLSAMMKIPAIFMTVSGFIVVEGEHLKWLMAMLGFAVAVKSWAAEKDVVMVWYGARGEKNPVLVHFIALVFFFLCVAANSLNQFVTHRDALAGEAGAKQAAEVYHKNRETLSRSRYQITSQVAAHLPGASEQLRAENRRLRQAGAAGEPVVTEVRDKLAAEVKGLQDAAAIVAALEPLPLDAPANADAVLAKQFDQVRIARAKLSAEFQPMVDDPRPADTPELSTRPVRLWQDATLAKTPDARLSWAVGLLLEALPLLTWLAAAKSIPIPQRIRRRRQWWREIKESYANWTTYALDYFIDPIGFSGSWRIEATNDRFTAMDLSSELETLRQTLCQRLGQDVTIDQLRGNDGVLIDPKLPLLAQLHSSPLLIAVTLPEDHSSNLDEKEAHK